MNNGVPVCLAISQLVITSIALIILTNTGGGNNMSFLDCTGADGGDLSVCLFHAVYWLHCVGS